MKTYSYRYFILALVLFVAIPTTYAQKFGYVNSAALLAEMPEVKQFESNLEALQRQLQKKGEGMVEKLQKDYIDVQEKIERGELSPSQQAEIAKSLEERQQGIAKFEQDMVNQLQVKRTQELQPIVDKVNKAISDVAEENGYEFILDQGVLLYAKDRLDVSHLVRAKLRF